MKKVFIIFSFLFIGLCSAFAQSNSPVGNWAKDKIGNSDYFLEIDATTIKYIDKKTEKYVIWDYYLSDNFMVFGRIVENTTNQINSELYKPLYEDKNSWIRFERSKDKMTIYFTEKGVKFITKEAKEKNAETAGAIAALATALIIKEATDTVASENEVKSLADKVYDAAW